MTGSPTVSFIFHGHQLNFRLDFLWALGHRPPGLATSPGCCVPCGKPGHSCGQMTPPDPRRCCPRLDSAPPLSWDAKAKSWAPESSKLPVHLMVQQDSRLTQASASAGPCRGLRFGSWPMWLLPSASGVQIVVVLGAHEGVCAPTPAHTCLEGHSKLLLVGDSRGLRKRRSQPVAKQGGPGDHCLAVSWGSRPTRHTCFNRRMFE